MTVHVQYKNDKYDYVSSQVLDDLITQSEIRQFYRPSEKRWVSVGVDVVRGAAGSPYAGPERRRSATLTQ